MYDGTYTSKKAGKYEWVCERSKASIVSTQGYAKQNITFTLILTLSLRTQPIFKTNCSLSILTGQTDAGDSVVVESWVFKHSVAHEIFWAYNLLF